MRCYNEAGVLLVALEYMWRVLVSNLLFICQGSLRVRVVGPNILLVIFPGEVIISLSSTLEEERRRTKPRVGRKFDRQAITLFACLDDSVNIRDQLWNLERDGRLSGALTPRIWSQSLLLLSTG